MAAPTGVSVEFNSQDTATLRWTYSGSAYVNVYRSTDGSSYTAITSFVGGTAIAPGTTTYTDSGLVVGTKYWYKLTDDSGSSFSSVVSGWTHSCLPPAGSLDTFVLPRAHPGGGDPVDEFNDMAERVESVLNGRLLAPEECVACPDDGQLILNCSGHCKDWLAVIDQDVNSISMQFCDDSDVNIELVIPPGATRIVRGWPAGFGFSGGEPAISGGTNGRSVNVGSSKGAKANPSTTRSRPSTGTGAGAGGGQGGCTCAPVGGNLTIKSCNANNSLNCQSTKSLSLKACGGRPPYTWSKTGTVSLSRTSGTSTTVTPPTNSGSGEPGSAYTLAAGQKTGAGCTNAALVLNFYGCNDAVIAPQCRDPGAAVCAGVGQPVCADGSCSGSGLPLCNLPDYCPSSVLAAPTAFCEDLRTAGMISAGCVPCGLIASGSGSTVTVTDSIGTQTTIVLKP